MKERYQKWAGRGVPKSWEDLGFDNPSGVVWPIVDSATCGPIDGFPKPWQWSAVALSPDMQSTICRLLNEECERRRDESKEPELDKYGFPISYKGE